MVNTGPLGSTLKVNNPKIKVLMPKLTIKMNSAGKSQSKYISKTSKSKKKFSGLKEK